MTQRFVRSLLAVLALSACGVAEDANSEVATAVQQFAAPGTITLPIGVSPRGTLIWCVVEPAALLPSPDRTRTVIVAGLDGDPAATALLQQNQTAAALGGILTGKHSRIWIPIANPDAWLACRREGTKPSPLTFPPKGSAYNTAGEVETAVLDRFLKWFAPDAVVEITPLHDADYLVTLQTRNVVHSPNGLLASLSRGDKAGPAPFISAWLPASLLSVPPDLADPLTVEYTRVEDLPWKVRDVGHGSLATAALARRARSPQETTRQLLEVYGRDLKTAMYQPALAVVARLRAGELSGDAAQRETVARILEPYLNGQKPSLDAKSNGSHFAGHLVFAEWARVTRDSRAVALVRAAADRAFTAEGAPREAMPTHNEMSDAVFMACPILAAAGRHTGEAKYIDMAGRHLAFMQKLCVRDDGLYRHSPLCETPWGRGNGFPALGLALALTELQAILELPPSDEPAAAALRASAMRVHAQMLAAFRAHIQALLAHQDPTGSWRQVIDHPGAYRELTATCMISFSLARGLRHGWLNPTDCRPALDRAWEAIQLRVQDDGVLYDVCTGTGKQRTLQDYLDREAIWARDERGGAMALMIAVEMQALLGGQP